MESIPLLGAARTPSHQMFGKIDGGGEACTL
jgi:hypothetical protein